MSKRLTIAIPEDLYERLQEVKQDINISGVCQEALNMAITLKELTKELTIDPFDRQKLIERLKLEKKLLRAQIKEQGFKLGVKSTASLAYKEFQRIDRLYRVNVRIDASAFADMWQLLKTRHSDNDLKFEDGELSHLVPLSDENKAIFVEGWLEGVLSVWNQIKDQVNDTETE